MQADVGWMEQELNEVRGDCRVLKEERDEAREKLESSTHIINELREELLKVRSQLVTEQADREKIEAELAELADLKQNSALASDLFEKVGKLTSLFKSLLPKNVKLPKGTILEIEKILGGNN